MAMPCIRQQDLGVFELDLCLQHICPCRLLSTIQGFDRVRPFQADATNSLVTSICARSVS